MFSQMIMTQTKWPTFSSTQKTKIAAAKSSCDMYIHCTYISSRLQQGQEDFLFMFKKKNARRPFLLLLLQPWAFANWECFGAFTCSESLTQHSRPHTLDRLFSPILVEVLKKKTETEREGGKKWARQRKRGKLKAVKLLGGRVLSY